MSMTDEPRDHKPPTVLHRSAADVALAAVHLVQQLEDDLRWAHAIGYGKATGGGGAGDGGGEPPPIRPVHDSDEPDHGTDQIAGRRFDIGHGDHACRAAYETVIGHLAPIEAATHEAITAVAVRDHPPIRLHPTIHSTPTTVQVALNGIKWRLLALVNDLPTVDDVTARRAKRHLLKAWSRLNAATLTLAKPLARERRPELDETRRCSICAIRPMSMRLKKLKKNQGWRMVPAKGGRCHTCAAWYLDPKHKGRERPRDLDSVDDALDAQRRRHDRGEGWGDA